MRTEGIRHTAANVIVVGLEPEEMGVIREALAADASLPTAPIDYADGLDTILHGYADVALISVDRDPQKAEDLARQVVRERLPTRMIALARKRDAEVILRAMRAGFNDVVVLPGEVSQLRAAVAEASLHIGDNEAKGIIVVLTGAKGGVGTSFLAAHLAAELASIHRVICLDFDFSMGDLAPMMDIVPKETIGDLLHRADQVDERSLAGSAFVHPSKVHFMCQPNDIDQQAEINAESVYALLVAAAGAYQYVIVDAGSKLDEATTTALNVADQIFVLATPDVVSIRDCHRKLTALNGLGVERKRTHVVLNKVPQQPFLSRETIEQNLNITVMGQIREDGRRVDHAINEGKLLRDLFPKAEIVTDIARLVGLLSDDPDEIAAATAGPAPEARGLVGGLLGRMFGR